MRSFSEEVAAARPRVLAVAERLVGDEAEDIVQEAIVRAYLSLSTLRDPERFAAWLTGIAVNVAKMRLRRLTLERGAVAVGAAAPALPPDDRELLKLVRDAVELLPPGQREVVLLHYVDDLSCEEIARLVDSSPGAVRVRLHRARAQLRRELAPHAPDQPRRKEQPMVEMKLEDVLLRVGEDGQPTSTCVVLLREMDGRRLLPIWIGAPEGAGLAYRVHGDSPPRPLTSDLMADLVRAAGAQVERVAITALREQVFYATISVAGDELDARPSDALNLAMRVGAPILVAEEVLAGEGVDDAAVARRLEEVPATTGFPLPAGEWRSLTADLLATMHPFPPRKQVSG